MTAVDLEGLRAAAIASRYRTIDAFGCVCVDGAELYAIANGAITLRAIAMTARDTGRMIDPNVVLELLEGGP